MKNIVLLFLLIFSTNVYAQDFNLDDYQILNEEVSQSVVDGFIPFEPQEVFAPEVNSFQDTEDDESQKRIEEMRQINTDLLKISKEIKDIVEKQKESLVMKSSFIDDISNNNKNLEERVSALENKLLDVPTREEVKVIVQEEVKKYVEVLVKNTKDNTVRK